MILVIKMYASNNIFKIMLNTQKEGESGINKEAGKFRSK